MNYIPHNRLWLDISEMRLESSEVLLQLEWLIFWAIFERILRYLEMLSLSMRILS